MQAFGSNQSFGYEILKKTSIKSDS